MIEIRIADISLRESEQVHAARMSFKEKLEPAKLLEKLRVDIIETGYVSDSPADAVFIRTLASSIETSAVSVPVTLDKQSVDRTWSALSKAKRPILNIVTPTSTVQMEYGRQIKSDAVIPLVSEITAHCAGLCPEVEFTAVDATRSEPEFLSSVLKAAISAGARAVTLCDSVGELLPDEFSEFVESLYASVPELRGVVLSVQFRDSLGLASAAALAGIKSGARQIKVSSDSKSRSLSLEQFLNVIKIRGETLGISYNINHTALQRTCVQLAALSGTGVPVRAPDDSPGVKEDAVLSADADIGALQAQISALGYDISDEDLERVYLQFKEIARNKSVVSRDIDALIAETAGQAPPVYRLKNYVINSGSAITATAFIELTKDSVSKNALSAGDGPIDAAFRAAEQIVGVHYELEDFQLQAVTGGREATGYALVKLRHGGKLFSGRGVATDIIGASIRAFLSAVNKIIYEERG
jgi:2-isopropylmalate synthase